MKPYFALLFLAGCASAASSGADGTTTTIDDVKLNNTQFELTYSRESMIKSNELNGSAARVYSALVESHGSVGLKKLSTDSVRMEVSYESAGVRSILGKPISNYVDCGRGAANVSRADTYSVTVRVDQKVVALSDTRAQLYTKVTATARNRGLNSDIVQCNSFGTLEARISELVAARL